MHLARIKLDLSKRDTLRALSNPSFFHSAIESSFCGERKRRLWRIDSVGDDFYVLVLSDEQGDFTEMLSRFGEIDCVDYLDYARFLEKLRVNQVWRFRLVANPVHSVVEKETHSKGSRGKVKAHVTIEQQRNWLLGKQAEMGVELQEGAFDVVSRWWAKFRKKNNIHLVSLRMVAFEGTFRIVDVQKLRDALVQGIGRGKAYGCGLLTLARPK